MKTLPWALFVLAFCSKVSGTPLLNVDFGAHLNPFFSNKAGVAAVGFSDTDYWNLYSRDGSSQFDWLANNSLLNLKWSDGSPSEADLFGFNAPGAWFTDSSDPMLHSYLYSFDGLAMRFEFQSLPAGVYDVLVYAHGQPASENARIQTLVDQVDYGSQTTSSAADWDAAGWNEGSEYVRFRNVNVNPGNSLTIWSFADRANLPVINGIQIQRSSVPDSGAVVSAALAFLSLAFFSHAKKRRRA